ncbi:hypothetical protein [Commensalibacter papalotli (ex Botero et al. 2024)]|uniref:cell division protein FtsL n=1 Tax=Commensalibacter papalotli (ex Botero et al. 2024) TaxID=2972766 RepID=UPI0022FF705D|nr:hypothetical protein [Commensalibacter papalotli (ex Botero et al. 2024)]CAI3939394.1 Predicted secreted (periplasmic) protein [Commensalibacter papalotli (ex Botero et al. 2024)]
MMIRPFTLFCAFFAGVSGMVLYAQKHKTTQLDREITKIVYDTQRIKSNTAMLRTEWTLLNQPDRLKNLANQFIPGLRPLNPSQFVQMAAVSTTLPPIIKTQEKDKTREDLVKNVAQNNGQPAPIIADTSSDKTEENKNTSPALIAKNTESSSPSVTQAKPQQTAKPITKPVIVAKNSVKIEPVTTSEPVRRKKVKTTEIADATDAIETQNLKPQTVKKPIISPTKNNVVTESVVTPAPVHRKKVKTTEIADATDAIEAQNLKPQPVKKNHIQNVSYNIQSDNPFSHNKVARPKQTVSSQTNTTNNEASLEKKLSSKPTQPTSTIAQKKRPAAIKVARNDSKKSNYTESALGGNADDALPAPVPFAH